MEGAREMTPEAIEIIKKNVHLADDQDVNIIDMLENQEELIKKFIALGYSREDFFNKSRYFSAEP